MYLYLFTDIQMCIYEIFFSCHFRLDKRILNILLNNALQEEKAEVEIISVMMKWCFKSTST